MKIFKLVVFIPAFFVLAVFGFKVVGAQTISPTITSITPTSGTGNTVVTVYGTNLTGATEVDFYNGNVLSAGLTRSSQTNFIVSSDGTSLNFTLGGAFGGMVSAGTYQVKVVTPVGVSNGLSFSFTPTAANAPTIISVSPTTGTANTAVTVYGTNLTGATEVDFYNASNQWAGSIAQQNISVYAGGSPLQFVFPATLAYNFTPGTYQLKVVTPVGTSNGQSFTVTAPSANAPTITSITPTSGTGNTAITIYGTNLTGATEVDFYNGNVLSAGLTRSSQTNFIVSSDGTSLNFTLGGAFGGMVSAGTYQVKVVTPVGVSNGLSFSFTPTAANAPTITNVSRANAPYLASISPSQGMGGTQVTITGSGFSASYDYYQSGIQTHVDNTAIEFGPILLDGTFIDSNHMTFIVPISSPVFGHKCGDVNCSGPVPPGNYGVLIAGNSMEGQSNALPFTILPAVQVPISTSLPIQAPIPTIGSGIGNMSGNMNLQARIQALQAELQQLETQLAQQGQTTSWCYTFNANLSVGMTGAGVTALQTALQKDGESVTMTGAFDDQTASAVTGFQQKYASDILTPVGLQNGTGYAGARTRTKLNSLYGCGASVGQ